MPDPIAAYHAAVKTIEDAWHAERWEAECRRIAERKEIARRVSAGEVVESRGSPATIYHSRWGLPPNARKLRDIQEEHGILPGDPRIHSIHAYKDEMAEIDRGRDRSHRERMRVVDAEPDLNPSYGEEVARFAARRVDLDARYYAGLDRWQLPTAEAGARSIDTPPKLWYCIRGWLESVEGLESYTATFGGPSGESRLASLLHGCVIPVLYTLLVPWATEEEDRSRAGRTASTSLLAIAARLERDEEATSEGRAPAVFQGDQPAAGSPVAGAEGRRTNPVALRPNNRHLILGRVQPELTEARNNVMRVIVEAYPNRVSYEELKSRSGQKEPHKQLTQVINCKESDWKDVIDRAGTKGRGGTRIVHPDDMPRGGPECPAI